MWLASVGRGIIAPKTGEIAGERVHFGSIVTAACAWECRLDFMCIKCVRNFNYVLWQEKKLKNQKKTYCRIKLEWQMCGHMLLSNDT